MARERDDRDDRDEDDRPRRRGERDDGYDDRPRLTPLDRSPGSTKAAGIIWVIMGSLVLLNVLVSTAVNVSSGVPIGQLLCGLALPTLIGAVFLNVGIQTLNGSAKGTLANGIGSIIFAALIGGLGGLLLVGSAFLGGVAAQGGGPPGAAVGLLATIALVAAVLYLLTGAMLLVAGILAIKGKTDYLRWRLYLKQQGGGSRDHRQDDEEDDRPRRRDRRDDD